MAAIRAAQRSGKPWYRTDEEPYSPKGAAVEPYTPKAASAAAEGDAGDTTHHVEVRFQNAPAGMRSGLTRADGPASVSVRTAYAMPGPY